MKEKIVELIENSDLPQLQKNVSVGFVIRLSEKQRLEKEDRELIRETSYGNDKLSADILLSTDEVKIYTITGKDEWDIKYPVRFIYKDNDGMWISCYTVFATLDLALIGYLEHKYLGSNSRFSEFAIKMLEIKVD